MKYIIASGWWSTDSGKDNRARLIGDDFIRSREFHKLWYDSLTRHTSPEKIIIVDSCSPVPPPINSEDERLEYVRLNVNPGHSTSHSGKYCGYTRAILVALEYALQCDCDYFVYVEQDALIYGPGIIEHCIATMSKPVMFGAGDGTPQVLQQSVFIIQNKSIRRFTSRLHQILDSDSVVSPEEKFRIAASRGPVKLLTEIYKRSNSRVFGRLNWYAIKLFRDYDHLPFGYGRTRPIDFKKDYFYFQHGHMDEIQRYKELLNI